MAKLHRYFNFFLEFQETESFFKNNLTEYQNKCFFVNRFQNFEIIKFSKKLSFKILLANCLELEFIYFNLIKFKDKWFIKYLPVDINKNENNLIVTFTNITK
ncbi:hypothetical protein EDEG_03149 [Edhazardia aedis USNM 41457]|uniref:Uncharacterized protein n=1 Tax=Edhazardia aedis (strain USNM 41457) TaxID=1003232 RepID=J9DIK4_EDHAE|nr:hypothetical protein EDEG_03149 [Edhazardia aedis USNM 41457]|eukprot:EJW02445.1 hypothetical protein EDEG_03149 [Edhazardia aedis USNM 41457]